MDTQYLLIDPLLAELSALRDRTATEPAEDQVPAIDAQCRALVVGLVAAATTEAPPPETTAWLATRTSEIVMVIGPALFFLAELPDGAVSLVSDTSTWSFDRDDTGPHVSYTRDDSYRSWSLLPDGAVQDRNNPALLEARLAAAYTEAAEASFADERSSYEGAEEKVRAEQKARADERRRAEEPSAVGAPVALVAPAVVAVDAPWHATHRVGAHPLQVGGVPEGTLTPGTVLDPRLPVRLLDTTTDGWAFVECSNGWRCYIAAWGIEPVEGVSDG